MYRKQIIMYYLPSGMFVISSWMSFVMEPTFPGRPALIVTFFLVIVSIFVNIINSTPSDDSGLTAILVWKQCDSEQCNLKSLIFSVINFILLNPIFVPKINVILFQIDFI